MLAAVKFSMPEYSKWGALCLPRATQALAGWRKRNPPRSRLPLPWEAFAAILVWLVKEKGEVDLALCLLLAYHAYLRPIELFSFRVWQLVAPISKSRSAARWTLVLHPREHNVSSKTGAYDQSLVLADVELYKPLAPLLHRLRRDRNPDEPLVRMPRPKVLKLLAEGAKAVGVGALAPVLHSLRHGGPSTDVALGLRGLTEVMKRGCWQSLRSVARYERGGRVAEQLSRLPQHVVASLLVAERSLWTILASR